MNLKLKKLRDGSRLQPYEKETTSRNYDMTYSIECSMKVTKSFFHTACYDHNKGENKAICLMYDCSALKSFCHQCRCLGCDAEWKPIFGDLGYFVFWTNSSYEHRPSQ